MNKHFLLVAALMCSSPLVIAHGDVTPQGVKGRGMPGGGGAAAGTPSRGHGKAIEVG